MIVDLERNDLSRVCVPGTIRWPELMRQRELAGVTHLVSTVEGRLRPGAGLAEILHATFPGGSITGAPKLAAIEHIARFEPVGRGASMGALGRVWSERRLRARTDDPHVRDRRRVDPPLGRRRDRLGLRPGGGDRGVVGQGAAAARGGRRPRARMTHDAARRRDRRPRARRSGRAGLPCRRRRAPPRRCGVRDDPRVRRPAVPARRPPHPLPLLRRGAGAAGAGRRGGPRRARRRRGAAGSRAAAVPHLAGRRRDGCGAARRPRRAACARAGARRPSTSGRPTSLLAGAKTTSYDVSFAARREAERAGADDALLVGGGARARGSDRERLVAARRRALHAGRAAGVLPGVTRAFVLSVERGARGRVRRRRSARTPTRRS